MRYQAGPLVTQVAGTVFTPEYRETILEQHFRQYPGLLAALANLGMSHPDYAVFTEYEAEGPGPDA